MKKSVLILIGVIYLVAIFIVSFIGLKIGFYEEKIYITKIECINENIKMGDEYKYIVINYNEEENAQNAVQLEWRITPDNTTNKRVKFDYDKTKTIAYVNEFGTVIFNKKGVIIVYILATDGTGIREIVKVIAK